MICNGVCVNGKCQTLPEVICGNHQHIDSGTCVCDTGWFGWDCDKPNSACGPHSHGYENWCVCDSGWSGTNCSIPIGSFLGSYHVTGVRSSWVGATDNPPVNIDEIMVVTLHDDSLIARGYRYLYGSRYGDTASSYPFGWATGYPQVYSTLQFHKVPDDSVFYYFKYVDLGGGVIINLKGVRIF